MVGTRRGSNPILIVDDEPNVRLVFRTALETVGYRVAEADDGMAALDALAEHRAALVLLDLQMPILGGMEVLERLRDSGNDVPVVIVTAHGSIPDAVRALKLGAVDFLAKPLSPDRLRKVVDEVIQRHCAPETPVVREPASGVAVQPLDRPAPAVVTLAPPVVDLSAIKLALNRRQFDRALAGLEEILAMAPDSAEALTLMGVLRESLGQEHAAYHAYKAALEADPEYGPALENMQRYCERFGLNFRSPAINPAAK